MSLDILVGLYLALGAMAGSSVTYGAACAVALYWRRRAIKAERTLVWPIERAKT